MAWRRKKSHHTCPALTEDGIKERKGGGRQTEIESRHGGRDNEGEQERVNEGMAERKIDG